jgi:hypothetical protein
MPRVARAAAKNQRPVPGVTARVIQSRPMRRRIPTAWAVSVLAHALVAGVLLLRVGRAPPVAEPAIEIEVSEVRRDELRAAPVVRPDDAPVPPPPPPRREQRHAGAPATSPSPSPPPSPTPGAAPHADDRTPADDRASEVTIPNLPPGRTPDLSLRGLPAGVRDKLAGTAPPPDAVLEARPHRPSVDELRVELERAEDAVANVHAGRVDPLLYDYLRGAKARLESEARRLAENIPLGPGETTRGWGRGYLERIREVSRPGAARDDQPDLRDDAARNRPDVLAGYAEAVRMADLGAEQRQVEICLDVAPGRESKAMLRRGSGSAALDRVALDSFEKSAAARPVPPDARAGRACYEVKISAYRVPPLPAIGCGFDLSDLRNTKCAWPFKKLTTVSSRLVSVDYPPPPGAARTRSLLRAPR